MKASENNLDFVAVDYDLGNEETGNMFQKILLQHGQSCPGIVFSGKDLSLKIIDSLTKQGFSEFVSKVDDEKLVSQLIEEAADRILESSVNRTYHIRTLCEFYNVLNNNLSYNSQDLTIGEWISKMEEGRMISDEGELVHLLVAHCNAIRKREDDYQFDSYLTR